MPDLEQELAYFEANRTRWLSEYADKFVLIKGTELVGTFDTAENAYTAGLERFGNTVFLIKQVLSEEPVAYVPALSLGLIRAHT